MKTRVVVIGAGVVGLSTAWYCARRGFDVRVLERHPAQRDGCSFGNAGLIVPSHFIPLAAPGMVGLALKWMWRPDSPFYIRPRWDPDLWSWAWRFWRAATRTRVERAAPVLRDLLLAGRRAFEELARTTGDELGLQKKGLLMLCTTDHGMEEEQKIAAHARQLGMPAEILDAQQVHRLNPGLRLQIVGGVFYPLDCHLKPERFMDTLQRMAGAAGASFLWQAEVREWVTRNRRIQAVRLQKGQTLEADAFVLCAGVWSARLARQLGLRLPLQAGKGYSLTLPDPVQRPQMGCICTEARVAVTPMNGTLRVGGTMELTGTDPTINPVRVRGIVRSFCRYFPDFQPEHFDRIQPWAGLRPCSPDGLPYLGRPAAWENLWIATGHAMLGLSLGPVSGQCIADDIAGSAPEPLSPLLAPDRYHQHSTP
ncbi:FAD-dependent oxidoreductase [Limisphaera ngatamarikiensis]|uniref:FAD-dependent oxidoreductase n=2 Tax=Limisphaera ngatamarikiensis TaxID=1324935 RepID=A0A6M1RN12_9BACT|nr:FAD-dependent oxidoreductase [Limisphaera ngatamarikiensis]